MLRSTRLMLVLAVAGLISLPIVSNAATSNSGQISDVPSVVLTDLGRAPQVALMAIAVTLKYRRAPQLQQLIQLQTDVNSPLAMHFLTNEQFNDAFAPSQLDYKRVIISMARAGFRISHTYSNRTVVDATGPVSLVERYFATKIHRIRQPGVLGTRYVNVSAAIEPSDLRGLLLNVSGLSTITLMHTNNLLAPPSGIASVPDGKGPPLRGPYGGFGPLAFTEAYDLPNLHGIDGTGRASGVVIDADYLDSDLAGFLDYFKVKRTGPSTTRVLVDGGPPSGLGSPDSVEATLDVETIVGNAPGTQLYVYEFPSFTQNSFITDAYNRVVSDNKVDTANSSFGGCETGFPSDARAWNAIAEQGAVKGITFHASTGDSGAQECGPVFGVAAPASGSNFVAVGGTSLSVKPTGRYVSETGWTESGGGYSSVFALPVWQHGVAGTYPQGRNLPDIAFDANPYSGAAFYYDGAFADGQIGGTSLSSPIYGAALAEINEVLGERQGLAGKTLFEFLANHGYEKHAQLYFHDIVVGINGYRSHKGYDLVTGIGSVDIQNFLDTMEDAR
jgi:kumamolisin